MVSKVRAVELAVKALFADKSIDRRTQWEAADTLAWLLDPDAMRRDGRTEPPLYG